MTRKWGNEVVASSNRLKTVATCMGIGAAVPISVQAQESVPVIASEAQGADTSGRPDSSGTVEGSDIVVTGTVLRGAAPAGAQIIEVTRETIDNRGFQSLQDALRSLPQTSTIGAYAGFQAVSRQNAGLNYGKGSSINLRGLGPDATLVLLNGRRIAPSGSGTFFDISQIPLAAVERVEIVTDGTSAIYGSDAVGGVVNIITPRSLRGLALEASGTVADGYRTARISAATGFDWGTGGITAAVEYRHTGLLQGTERDYFGRDQTRFGGPDLRVTYCAPGNVTAGGVTYALPEGDGVGLTPSDLTPGTSNKCDVTSNTTLYPRSDAWSAVLHGEQELGSGFKVFADFLYSRRKTYSTTTDQIAYLTVPSSNAYFIPFTPELTSVSVQYNFVNDLGVQYNISKARSVTAVGGFNYDFAAKWRASVFYGYSRATDISEARNDLNMYYIRQALASSDPATAFNPFGSGGTSNAALIDSFRGYSIRPTRFNQQQLQGVIDGAIGDFWGAGDIKVAVGGEWLDQDYLETSRRLTDTATEVAGASSSGARSDTAVFAEIAVPLIGPETVPGLLRSATLSAAVRRDDYSDFGATTNPRFGIDIEPFMGFHLRGTWGKSFKAPILSQLSPSFTASVSTVADPASPTGTTVILNSTRRDQALRPETARTWTLGFAYADAARTPLTLSATYFNIDYTDRIELLQATTILANADSYATFINRSPTAAQIAAIQSDPNLSSSFTIPAEGIGAIISSGYRNTSSIKVRGVDVSAGYWWQLGAGRLSVSGSVSRMFSYDTRSADGLPTLAAVNLIGYPNKWRGIGDIAFETERFRVFTGGNVIGAYRNNGITPEQRVPAYVTINAGVRLNLDRWLPEGTSIQLSGLNIFDRKPPLVLGQSLGFDGNAADPIGRQVSLLLRTKI